MMICSFSQQDVNSAFFADDSTLYSCDVSYKNVYEWFVYNSMKANCDNFQFIILGNTDSQTLPIVH